MRIHPSLNCPLIAGGCALGLLLAAAGCTTVNPTSVTAFSTGVTAARAETSTAFETVVKQTRESAVDYAAAQPSLNEGLLVATPSPEAIAAWNRILDPLEHYAQHMSSLGTGGSSGDAQTAIGGLAKEFNATSADLKAKAGIGQAPQITAGPAAALATVAGALLDAHAEKEAAGIAKATDPAIRTMLTALADAIGPDAGSGLRGTVRGHWNQQLIDVTQDFLAAGTPASRRPVVLRYIDLLNQRDASDDMLASLRSTYLALADAHTAIAKGSDADLRGAIDLISTELKHARDLQAQFAKTLTP